MSHGAWPIKQRDMDENGNIHNPMLRNRDAVIYEIASSDVPANSLKDIHYNIPDKTSFVTTTNMNNLSIACKRYDDVIQTYIQQHGINIFLSNNIRKTTTYQFLKQSRLYNSGDLIVDLRISFEENRTQWNIWSLNEKNRKLESFDINYNKTYKISEIINKIKNSAKKDIHTNIILHCCMPAINSDYGWISSEQAKLKAYIQKMMEVGTQNNTLTIEPHPQIVERMKTRAGIISRHNQTQKNTEGAYNMRQLRYGRGFYTNPNTPYTNNKNTINHQPNTINHQPKQLKINIQEKSFCNSILDCIGHIFGKTLKQTGSGRRSKKTFPKKTFLRKRLTKKTFLRKRFLRKRLTKKNLFRKKVFRKKVDQK
jgi:hypothetical protein